MIEYYYIARAREDELNVAKEKIEYRRQWYALNALDRLESAVSRARVRLAEARGRVAPAS